MNRTEKEAVVSALQERFAQANVALVATNKGLTVEQANALRRTLKAAGGEYKVAKHTLTKRAVGETRYASLVALLEGPRSLVFGFEDPVALTKAVVAFADQNKQLEIDGGAVEGQLIRADQVKALASMPSLDVLRAGVVRQAMSPGTRLVSMAIGPAKRIAGAIAALVEKLEKEGVA
jgi:large subunit ribosomal protein L10